MAYKRHLRHGEAPCGPCTEANRLRQGAGVTRPKRIQLRRAKGWRKPEGAVIVARPGPYGNPFPVDSPWMTWAAIAIGLRADKAGRRRAAVALHRAWMLDKPIRLREYDPISNSTYDGGALEFSDGTVVSIADHAVGIAVLGASLAEPPVLPERPDVSALRGKDLACWCPVDQPCHGDTLLELANA